MTDSNAPMQLTIDGEEVRHPPPRPRGECPYCEKLITFNNDGTFHHHKDGYGAPCAMSGRRPDQ